MEKEWKPAPAAVASTPTACKLQKVKDSSGEVREVRTGVLIGILLRT